MPWGSFLARQSMDEAVEVKHLRLIRPIQPVGAENVIGVLHAANSYSWMRPPSLSILRSRFAPGDVGVETGDLDRGAI